MAATAKIGRELRRIGHRALDAAAAVLEPVRARRHDRDFSERVRLHPGSVPPREKAALFVLYQPGGLAASSIATCRHLATCGYSPLAVSNAALSDDALAQLAPVTWMTAVRPNFGYDFGAYRDGVRLLADHGAKPARLVMLNDSIWFPLHPGETLLAEMEQSGSFCGPMFDRKEGRRHSGHFESYLLSLGPQALGAPAFTAFWQGYVSSDQRRIVLRRGEKGFSQALLAAGIEPTILASRALFADRLRQQDDGMLRRTLDYAAYESPAEAAEGRRICDRQPPGFRDAALAHIIRTAAKQNIQECFVYAAMRLFNLPFLKKRMKPLTIEMRRQYLRAVTAGDLPAPPDALLAEIRASVPPAP